MVISGYTMVMLTIVYYNYMDKWTAAVAESC